MTPLAYVRDAFLPAAGAALDLHDSGLLWGALVVDRLRTFDGRLFRMDDHLARFRESCRLAHIPLERSDAEIADISDRLVSNNRDAADLSLIWLATPAPCLVAYTQPLLPGSFTRLYTEGARLITRPATTGVDPRVKHRSRLSWWIAQQEARAIDPLAEPLFLDPRTHEVLETPTANVLAVLDGALVGPPPGRVLAGVSVRVVEELAGSLGLPVGHRSLAPADLAAASEIILTNTSYCLAGVSRLDGRPVPFPGPILGRLLEAWSDRVGVNLCRRSNSES